MTVVIARTSTPEGRAALAAAVEEVARRQEDLLDAAEQADASAIVIGVKHRSPVGKLLLGSAAQQVLLEANAPVIAVKPHRS